MFFTVTRDGSHIVIAVDGRAAIRLLAEVAADRAELVFRMARQHLASGRPHMIADVASFPVRGMEVASAFELCGCVFGEACDVMAIAALAGVVEEEADVKIRIAE